MKVIHLIRQMHREGILGSKQLSFLEALDSGKIFSAHGELRAALYLGVLLIAAGAGWTVKVS
jgi:hypothetical protein